MPQMNNDDLIYDNPKPIWELSDAEALMWLRQLYPDLPKVEYGAMLALMRGQEINDQGIATEKEYEEHLASLSDPNTITWPQRKSATDTQA